MAQVHEIGVRAVATVAGHIGGVAACAQRSGAGASMAAINVGIYKNKKLAGHGWAGELLFTSPGSALPGD